jgi:pimeloyl-ACP methyl ester carboxylesterase
MKPYQSEFIKVRGLNYHCRTWGREGAPKVFMLHGFQDVSASWQFTVDALEKDWHVIAPDWRGYGLTDWAGQDTYWFPDFIADLDAILDHFEPELPASIVAHSMGTSRRI